MAINSIVNFIETLKKFPRDKGYEYFYRGHSDHNFALLPSIYRAPKSRKRNPYIKSEDKIFREIIIRTPADFTSERTTIEKLVKMQHYGLPSRILDITSNPLVALYFACKEKINNNNGEVIVFKIPKDEVKFYDSDTVSILSNLAKTKIDFDITDSLEWFDHNEAIRKKIVEHPDFGKSKKKSPKLNKIKDELLWVSIPEAISAFNESSPIPYLLHEIKDEKPQFMPIIAPHDFNRVLAVRVKLNNNRILKQSGAFLLFGINKKKIKPAEVSNSWILNKSFKQFDLKISSNQKARIINDLDALGINDSTLYPELEQQSKYIKRLFAE